MHLTQRKATIKDLPIIVQLLVEDELGQTRETYTTDINTCYRTTFEKIDSDPNQYLMVICTDEKVIGTCHLTLMPSLTYQGSMRMQIEAVRIAKNYRGQKLGEWMMQQAFDYAKQHDVKMIQLTTNKLRPRAKQFYEHLGFQASHEGMKYFLGNHNVE
jgi:N-acetylglutamate synthase-like GNAT family acetyltransferase